MTVTLLEPSDGKRRLTAWCWQFVSRFAPSINGKNVVCLVKNGDGTTFNHPMKWAPALGTKKRTRTSGLSAHIEKKHPTQYQAAMSELGTSAERKAPVAAAIGEKFARKKKNDYRKKN